MNQQERLAVLEAQQLTRLQLLASIQEVVAVKQREIDNLRAAIESKEPTLAVVKNQ